MSSAKYKKIIWVLLMGMNVQNTSARPEDIHIGNKPSFALEQDENKQQENERIVSRLKNPLKWAAKKIHDILAIQDPVRRYVLQEQLIGATQGTLIGMAIIHVMHVIAHHSDLGSDEIYSYLKKSILFLMGLLPTMTPREVYSSGLKTLSEGAASLGKKLRAWWPWGSAVDQPQAEKSVDLTLQPENSLLEEEEFVNGVPPKEEVQEEVSDVPEQVLILQPENSLLEEEGDNGDREHLNEEERNLVDEIFLNELLKKGNELQSVKVGHPKNKGYEKNMSHLRDAIQLWIDQAERIKDCSQHRNAVIKASTAKDLKEVVNAIKKDLASLKNQDISQ